MPCPVVAWELMVKDLAKQYEFCRQVFDWEFATQPGQDWVAVNTGGGEGTITKYSPPQSDMTLVVQVEDVVAVVDKVLRLGGRVVHPPGTLPDGSVVALLRDPEGNLFWVAKPTPAS